MILNSVKLRINTLNKDTRIIYHMRISINRVSPVLSEDKDVKRLINKKYFEHITKNEHIKTKYHC